MDGEDRVSVRIDVPEWGSMWVSDWETPVTVAGGLQKWRWESVTGSSRSAGEELVLTGKATVSDLVSAFD